MSARAEPSVVPPAALVIRALSCCFRQRPNFSMSRLTASRIACRSLVWLRWTMNTVAPAPASTVKSATKPALAIGASADEADACSLEVAVSRRMHAEFQRTLQRYTKCNTVCNTHLLV